MSQQEAALPTFTISGKNVDEVSAKLKSTLEANEAKFNANFNAMFKPAPQSKPTATAAGIRSAIGAAPEAGCRLSSRKDKDDASLRDRMRNSLRSR